MIPQYYIAYLCHHGIKGQKWGIRRTPEQLGHKKSVSKTTQISVVQGHSSTPKQSVPNSIIDHYRDDGIHDVRTFYDANGKKCKDIHLTSHGNEKHHKAGHVVMYSWNDDCTEMIHKSSRDLTDLERKENGDIL